jgi:1-acyl-sn-glycerol-3-phosphate acyltransferase
MGELGHVRAFAKQALAYQPAMGWFGYLLNYIFLRRNWETDKLRIDRFETPRGMKGSALARVLPMCAMFAADKKGMCEAGLHVPL